MQVINAVVITDPFAPNYGLEKTELPYHEGWTLQQYIDANFDQPEFTKAYVNLLRPESMDVVLTPDDGLLVSSEIGYEGLSAFAAWLGSYFSALGAGYGVVGAGVVAGAGVGITTVGGMIAGWAVALAVYAGGMMLVNSLLAPDSPSRGRAQGADNSRAYQWGQTTNTAEEMIPKPVGLGTFSVRGNLLASRTESFNSEKPGYSIQETIYLLYSLSNNKLSALNSVKINGMDVSTFSDDDISVYYTLGGNDQAALNTETALSFLPSDPVAPASQGVLFPNLGIEVIKNLELEPPDHLVTVALSGTPLIGYTPANVDAWTALTAATRSTTTKTETSTIEIKIPTQSSYGIDDFTGRGVPCFAAFSTTDDSTYAITKENILISAISDAGIVGDYQYINLTIHATYGDRELPQQWPTNSAVTLVDAVEQYGKIYTVASGGTTWDQYHYVPTTSWTTYTSASSNIEDLEFQFTLPAGLYMVYGGTHHGHDAGVKMARWETYGFHLIQRDASTNAILKDSLFTPPDDGETGSIIWEFYANPTDPGLPRGFFTFGSYKHAHSFSIKATDVIREKTNYSSLYTAPESGSYIVLGDGSTILNADGSVAGEGFLPSGYIYEFKVRVNGHGSQGRHAGMTYSTRGPNSVDSTSDVYGTRLYRVRELNYGEVLRYPDQPLLAVVINATPVTGGTLPDVLVNCDWSHKYWNGSAWAEGFTNNPAELATALCYSGLWGGGVGGDDYAANKGTDIADEVDLAKFREFAIHCDDTTVTTGELVGEKNFIYNGYLDTQRPFWDVLTEICSVANARPHFDGAKITVYWEKDIALPTQVFNSTLIKQNTYTENYINSLDVAEAVNGSFIDEDTDEKTAVTWTFPLGNPLKTVSIELPGVTNRHRAMRAVQYKLNKTNIIKRACFFETWTNALSCEVGDLVTVENEFVKWGNDDIGGRLVEVDSANMKVTLDRLFTEPVGIKYIMLRASSDDGIGTWTVTNWDNTGAQTILTVSGVSIAGFTTQDPFVVGVGASAFGKFIVSSIDIHGDFSVSIGAMEYIEQSQLDSGLFTITANTIPGITKENFCPRNITCTPDYAETEVTLTWDAPFAAESEDHGSKFSILRYQVWRKRGAAGSYEIIAETDTTSYLDQGLSQDNHYFYKVIPVFNYYGAEAVIPLSWCSNFTDSGNDCVDTGVDFNWSIYDYLPLPDLSLTSDHPNGYLITENRENSSLADVTIFVEDPDNWRYHNSSEGFLFWLRLNDVDDTTSWFGPTGITLSAGCAAGASTITVSSVTGLTIPGLIVIGNSDLVYVHSELSNVLTLGHPSYFDADETNRKFTIGTSHSSGECICNAHKGFYPIRYFGFEENTSVITNARQVTCSNIHKYNIATNVIVTSSDWAPISQVGVDKYRAVFSNRNVVGFIESAVSGSFILRGPLVPPQGDFTVNLAFMDVSGRPNSIYSAVWSPVVIGPGDILRNQEGDLYFTIQGIPQAEFCWVAISRALWDAELGSDTHGWTSHIKAIGV